MKPCPVSFVAAPLLALTVASLAADTHEAAARKQARDLQRDGNYAEAYDVFRKLACDERSDPDQVGSDLTHAVDCLRRLNRNAETDALRETAVASHPANRHLLGSAARSLFGDVHYGFIIAGEFRRGHHRGGGRYAGSFDRDRARALQLMERARPLLESEAGRSASDTAAFYFSLADILVAGRDRGSAWRLQELTDLAVLPDVVEGRWAHASRTTSGAPVLPDGTPVVHQVPGTFEDAQTDGQRWRWALQRAARETAVSAARAQLRYAGFLEHQFGVHTMGAVPMPLARTALDAPADRFLLHTLNDDETIARLATGIRRFDLPEDAAFIRHYRTVAGMDVPDAAENALERLAAILENRRQYPRAAAAWQESIERFGPGHQDRKQKRLDQIVTGWGRFEPCATFPAGRGATVEYRFRNGRQVMLTAHRIKVRALLDDVKALIRSNPRRLDWRELNIGDIGYRLVKEKQDRYVGDLVVLWREDLEPRADHFDTRVTLETPLTEPGAYLLTASMEDGNTSKIVLWIHDTVLVRKNMEDRTWFFAADAVSGRPLPGMNIDFFGFRRERPGESRRDKPRTTTLTTAFAEFTDGQGTAIPDPEDFKDGHQWMIVASGRAESDAADAVPRLAYLGFSSVWHRGRRDRDLDRARTFLMTDRPVYRPNQAVRFKAWIRRARYDLDEDASTYAGQTFTVRISDPQGKKVYEQSLVADDYGGLSAEWTPDDEAALGVYGIHVPGYGSGCSFRLEEYKKPEFEVTVDGPQDTVRLGDSFALRVKAAYYFGVPVTRARVHYKVLRQESDTAWYPPEPWDWLYGRGYGWLAETYSWYPGWRHWGCARPDIGIRPFPAGPPEVVAEGDAAIGEDGTVVVPIDTSVARDLYGDGDQEYTMTAEVTDASRRTIVGNGRVLATREPFRVAVWVDRGFYRTGQTIHARLFAHTPAGDPVTGDASVRLLKILYTDGEPAETAVRSWTVAADPEGHAHLQLVAAEAGQYRLSCLFTDRQGNTVEGAYLFTVRGAGPVQAEDGFRFNAIELIPDRREYTLDQPVNLLVNTAQSNSTVLLFVRPVDGVYPQPRLLSLDGRSRLETLALGPADMPNCFVEAMTIHDGKLHTTHRELYVPPQRRVLNVELQPEATNLQPGAEAGIAVRITDLDGRPVAGTCVMTVYDRAVEYISGGSNVGDIRSVFWEWRRNHWPQTESNLGRILRNLVPPGDAAMQSIGVFGETVADDLDAAGGAARNGIDAFKNMPGGAPETRMMAAASMAVVADAGAEEEAAGSAGGPEAPEAAARVRSEFADTACWKALLATDTQGMATVRFPMPENLTTWQVRTWALTHGTRVGAGATELITTKDLLVRLQAPRFFVERDRVTLSANVHNYLPRAQRVRAVLQLDGPCLALDEGEAASRRIVVAANGEARVDWQVRVLREGEAVVRMKALSGSVSDAVEMRFPAYVHGMLKTDSFSRVIPPDGKACRIAYTVPVQRRVDSSRLLLRYSPSLAASLVDALPYLADYPYGCTEQTLNRFLPTVIVRNTLTTLGVSLEQLRAASGLDPQQPGDAHAHIEAVRRARGQEANPVFDEHVLERMVKDGVKRLTAMQLDDGGWGWFSGWGERASPHTTAIVMHGLQVAMANGVAVVPQVTDRGTAWLKRYQERETLKLRNAGTIREPRKTHADNVDALVFLVLVEAGHDHPEMRGFLYRDRNQLSLYAKAMLAIGMHTLNETAPRDMLLRNIEQYRTDDAENQTAWLNVGGSPWWHWYGSDAETHAWYLKALTLVAPKAPATAAVAKYLLNNRKYGAHWDSTRDTAYCIEALAAFVEASGERAQALTAIVYLDDEKRMARTIAPEALLSADNRFELTGAAIESGEHDVRVEKRGPGPLYVNATLSTFTLEDMIPAAGLDLKIERRLYRLHRAEGKAAAAGSRGQATAYAAGRYIREPLPGRARVTSGDLVEIELEIESKNDYEYVVIEDRKAAGMEPVDVRSGYTGNELGAYVEYRDERVVLFVQRLARGRHSVAYRLRAETPGNFSALPARIYGMYAPQLAGNSREQKVDIDDTE